MSTSFSQNNYTVLIISIITTQDTAGSSLSDNINSFKLSRCPSGKKIVKPQIRRVEYRISNTPQVSNDIETHSDLKKM